MGWTVDYGDVKEVFKPVYKQLDHHMLNELPGIADGDAASILHWIRSSFAHQLPPLDRIDLFETPGCGALLSWGRTAPSTADVIGMTYSVKEIFYTIQGEGYNAGRVAVFCRFSGCNLWSGLERDRNTAVCQFCDTEFVGTDGAGGKFATEVELVDRVEQIWVDGSGDKGGRFIVCTGGEPLLQLDERLVQELHSRGFYIAVETNGTQLAPRGIDWITVSPKAGAEVVLSSGNELKLVYPQESALPERFSELDFENFFLQPMDGPSIAENTQRVIQYCHANPQWRVSVQTHKILGVP